MKELSPKLEELVAELDGHILKFKEAIREVLSQLDPEAAQLFLDRFTEKLNEQKCTQENSGTSR